MKKRFHLYIAGRVQGVFFRANTCQTARSLGLTGWVKNLADGRVEVVVEGEAQKAVALVDWCRQGEPPARVDGLLCTEETPTGSFGSFEILP